MHPASRPGPTGIRIRKEVGEWPPWVWFFDELFLQHTIDLGRLKVIPIEVVDPLGPAAYGELARSEGWDADVSLFKVGVRNLAAFVLDDVDASSPNEGLLLSGPVVGDVAAAVAYRQKGRGRAIGTVVDLGPGQVFGSVYQSPGRMVTNLSFTSEADEVVAILRSYQDRPQARVFAELFAEACRDPTHAAAITRLWAILEAISDEQPGGAATQVTAALKALEIADPEFQGRPLPRPPTRFETPSCMKGRRRLVWRILGRSSPRWFGSHYVEVDSVRSALEPVLRRLRFPCRDPGVGRCSVMGAATR